MRRLNDKEKKFINKCDAILRNLLIIVGFVFIFVYLIRDGFNLLVFGIRGSKMLITYSIAIIILLSTLIFVSVNEDETLKDSNFLFSKHLMNIVSVLLVIFSLLFIFSLIDFILPIVILVAILILSNYLISNLVKILIIKYGIK